MKRFLLFWTILSIILVAPAQECTNSNPADDLTQRETHVTTTEALNVGYTFMRTGEGTRGDGTRSSDVRKQTMQLIYTCRALDSITRATTDCYYVFAVQPKGFVIVAADNRVEPILGYSYDNNFVVENIPDHVRGWLNGYERQIEYAVKQNLSPEEDIIDKWSRLKSGQAVSTRNRNTVGPLLTTTWDQGQYYNSLCPEAVGGPDGHALTGCVATAMAQIINYWGYPAHGHGTHSYVANYGTMTVNYDSANYDYANMPNALTATSTPEEVNAVATLMRDCGVANVMIYGPSSSGADKENIRPAFINLYGFSSKLGYADRNMYTNDEWITLLRNEIDLENPVYYTGTDGWNSHAFVLDGYTGSDYFHFNFGWSGAGDGWYLTSAINPSLEFNYWQQAIVGIRPDSTKQTVLCNYVLPYANYTATPIPCHEHHTVTSSIHLYNISAKNEYLMNYDVYGQAKPLMLHFSPSDSSGQLVLDIFNIDINHAIVVYDGANMDSLLSVLEPAGEGWPNAQLPNDSVLQQFVTNDFSPIVSTKHGFTIVAYCAGMIEDEFHLLVSDASTCRMVSNIDVAKDSLGYRLNWMANGASSQWQISWADTTIFCDTTSFLINNHFQEDNLEVKIRSICSDNTFSEWNTVILNQKKYWPDFVEEEPDGFVESGDTVIIASAEGLAWLSRQYEDYNSRIIVISNDIDLSAHLWRPIPHYYGKILGNGHVISNLRTGYFALTGLFYIFEGNTISDLHLKNATTCGYYASASFAAWLDHAILLNCSSIDYKVRSKAGTIGGLIGRADYSQIINCNAIGENYSQCVNGGLVGWNLYSAFENCYSSQGSSFQWQSVNSDVFQARLLAGIDIGGSYNNCYADIKNTPCQWNPEVDSMATLYYFFGFSDGDGIQIESASNVATFRVVGDTLGCIIEDTSINYTMGENTDLLTALNNKVIEYNAPELRTWIWDSTLHFPVLGPYYEPARPTIRYVTQNGTGNGSSWANAMGDLQAAMDSAALVQGDVWVAQGTYYGDDASENAFTVPDGVHVYGGFAGNEPMDYDLSLRNFSAHPTILDGRHTQRTVYHERTVYYDWMGAVPVLDGFTIQNGFSDGYGGNIYGGNVYYGGLPSINVRNCIIRDGEAYEAGGVSNAIVQNSLVYNNVAQNWAGAFNKVVASNCLLSNDSANVSECLFSTLTNCILWHPRGYNQSFTNNITYSAIENWDGSGEGNILLAHDNDGASTDSNYVRFVDPENGDFRLAYGSACINAGTPDISELGLPAVDLQGLPRVLDGRIDMGAYEYYPVPVVEMFDTICEGNSIVFFDSICTATGSHVHHINTDITQDTMYVLHLTVNQPTPGDTTAVACESFTWNDSVYTQSGDYTQTFTAANGCDSVVTLHLTVNHPTYGDTTVVACDSFTWHDSTYTSSGSYQSYLTNVSGCDSIVTLYLTINHPVAELVEATACESYTWNGTTYSESGEYPITLTTAAGCDSVVTLHLTVNHPTYSDTTVVACDSYIWYDSTYTSSGTYQSYLTNATGCDSIVTLYLTINHPVAELVEATACESYTWNGTTYSESGEYPITLTTAAGCDSVVTLHLTLFENEASEFTITTNDPCYTWNDVEYCESGDYTQTLETVHGCDSVVTLHLTIGVGIDDHDGFNFKVYPNPTSNIVNVEFGMDNGELGDVKIQLYDVFGKLLDVTNVVGANDHSPLRAEIDLSRYANGVYIIKLVSDRDGRILGTQKIVKQ